MNEEFDDQGNPIPPVVAPPLQPPVEPPVPPTVEIDYDRIIQGVSERMAPPPPLAPVATPNDPYAAMGDLMYENPAEALRMHGEMIRQQTMSAMMPYIQPVATSHAMSQAGQGLPEQAAAEIATFVQENKIDPALLNDPIVAKLVRGYAENAARVKHGENYRVAPPNLEGGPVGGPHIDADTRGTLSALQQMASGLNMTFDEKEILRRAGR